MGLVKKIFKRTKDKKEVVNEEQAPAPIKSYEEEPERAAEIVSRAIEKGQLAEIGTKLEELPGAGYSRTRYVFDAPDTTRVMPVIIVCALFIMAYLYFVILGIAMGVFSNEYGRYSFLFVAVSLLALVVNFMLIGRLVNRKKFVKRYEKYTDLFKYKNAVIVDDICEYTSVAYPRVVKDLAGAVKQKLIPEGHFTTDNLVFISSDEMYSRYEENKPLYDRYYRKLIEQRIREDERTEEIQKILDLGQSYIDKIHNSNEIIKDREISEKLDYMEKIVTTIFHELDLSPEQSGKLGMFLDYYLPSMDKLLSAYIDISEKKIEGSNIRNAKKDIVKGLDMLIVSFDGTLNQFYEEKELDIASEVATMENMIKQEDYGR